MYEQTGKVSREVVNLAHHGSLDDIEIAAAAPKPTKPPKSTAKTEKLLKAHRPTRVTDHLDPEVAAKLRLIADKGRYGA